MIGADIGVIIIILIIIALIFTFIVRVMQGKLFVEVENKPVKTHNGFGLSRGVKFLIFLGIITAALINYKMFDFDYGFLKSTGTPADYISDLSLMVNTEDVYYYKMFDEEGDSAYMFIVKTKSKGAFGYAVSKQELAILKTTFIVYTPEEIYPTHWGWFIGGILLLLFLPSKR